MSESADSFTLSLEGSNLTKYMEILSCDPFGDLELSSRILTALRDTYCQKISEATCGKFEYLDEAMQKLL